MSTRRELTQKSAIAILNSYGFTNELGVAYKGIEISSVQRDNDGEPFTWVQEDGTEQQYAIVNLKAQNSYGRKVAGEILATGTTDPELLQKACNTNLSISIPIDQAESMAPGMYGVLTLHEVETRKRDSNGDLTEEKHMELRPRKFSVQAPVVAKSNFDFSSFVKASAKVDAEA